MTREMTPQIDPALLGEAVDWLMRFQSEDTVTLRSAFERWHKRSPEHAAAWARAESLIDTVRRVPPGTGHLTLAQADRIGRRRALRGLAALGVAAPLGCLFAPEVRLMLQSDLRTATAERRHLDLADGTTLTLNARSAVRSSTNGDLRRIELLQGEILLTTPRPQTAPRLLLATRHGHVEAADTRFSVRTDPSITHVSVFEGAVRISSADGHRLELTAGKQTYFDTGLIAAPTTLAQDASQWEHGLLVAREMPLREVLARLAPYRRGHLGCDDAVATLAVSGVFSLDDTEGSLNLLARSLPVRLATFSRWWVSLEPVG